MKIAVVGIGYVGLSNAILLAQNHHVVAFDVNPEKVSMINSRESPIIDSDIEIFFKERALDLTATLDKSAAYENADYITIEKMPYFEKKNRLKLSYLYIS